MLDPNSREERAFLSALYEHRDDEPTYEQQERLRAYVNGTDDQYEDDAVFVRKAIYGSVPPKGIDAFCKHDPFMDDDFDGGKKVIPSWVAYTEAISHDFRKGPVIPYGLKHNSVSACFNLHIFSIIRREFNGRISLRTKCVEKSHGDPVWEIFREFDDDYAPQSLILHTKHLTQGEESFINHSDRWHWPD